MRRRRRRAKIEKKRWAPIAASSPRLILRTAATLVVTGAATVAVGVLQVRTGAVRVAHLRERGHGDRFTALMDQLLPDWRSRRDALDRAPLADEDWRVR